MASNLLKAVIIFVLLVGVTGCSANTSTNDTPTKRQLFLICGGTNIRCLFDAQRSRKSILEAFDVVITENEDDAYV